jgi:hypothetical protein
VQTLHPLPVASALTGTCYSLDMPLSPFAPAKKVSALQADDSRDQTTEAGLIKRQT